MKYLCTKQKIILRQVPCINKISEACIRRLIIPSEKNPSVVSSGVSENCYIRSKFIYIVMSKTTSGIHDIYFVCCKFIFRMLYHEFTTFGITCFVCCKFKFKRYTKRRPLPVYMTPATSVVNLNLNVTPSEYHFRYTWHLL